VSLLLDDRVGFMLTDAWAPHGSDAEMEPRLLDSRLESEGLNDGLCEGDASALLSPVIVELLAARDQQKEQAGKI
jgi:hypothetical protein